MLKHAFYCLVPLLLVFMLNSPNLFAAEPSLNNVSYSSVTALQVRAANKKIAYGKQPLQYGLLWLPEAHNKQDKSPLVVFIHGGCWLSAYDISHSYAATEALAQAGYAVWSLEYRRTGDEGGGWPGSYEDITAGIKHIDKLQDYGLDLSRVVLAGHSAGGHLALLVGGENPQFTGVIGLAAIIDFETYAQGSNSCQAAGAKFIGAEYSENAAAYVQANPSKQIMHLNSILLQGDADTIVSVEQARDSELSYSIVKGAGHFDWIHPQSLAFEEFLLTLTEVFSK